MASGDESESLVDPAARVGPDVQVGNGSIIDAGSLVEGRVLIGEGVHIAPHALILGDDRKHLAPKDVITVLGARSAIGAGAIVKAGVRVGTGSLVEPGAVVTQNVPPNAVVAGNPAQIVGYTTSLPRGPSTESQASGPEVSPRNKSHVTEIVIPGVEVLSFTQAHDLRGGLVAIEFSAQLPFKPERAFFVLDVPSSDVRGEHAHRQCAQVLIAARGSVRALVDNGRLRQEFLLMEPDVGLYMPPMTWGTQFAYSDDALLLVLASHAYDPHDYINDYEEFVQLVVDRQSPPGCDG